MAKKYDTINVIEGGFDCSEITEDGYNCAMDAIQKPGSKTRMPVFDADEPTIKKINIAGDVVSFIKSHNVVPKNSSEPNPLYIDIKNASCKIESNDDGQPVAVTCTKSN